MQTGSANTHNSLNFVLDSGDAGRGTIIANPDAKSRELSLRDGIYRINGLEKYPELLHGISTRRAPDGTDWNLSARRGTPEHPPSLETAQANRRKFAAALGVPIEQVIGCQQVHSADVAIVGEKVEGETAPHASYVPGVDALITSRAGLYLMALAADCPTVFFYDPVHHAIGLAHSGWKGTVGKISANVVQAMTQHFDTSPSEVVVAVGPGIGPCCYAVGSNVVEALEVAFRESKAGPEPLLETRAGQAYANLHEAIRRTLIDAGLRAENISIDRVCTAHNIDTFYSHRAELGQCGLFGAIFGLK